MFRAIAQAAPTAPDLSPLAYWGVAGSVLSMLLSLLTWLLVAERREHRDLQKKVIDDVLPVILTSTMQQRETIEALRQVDKLASRASIEPAQLAEWVRVIARVQDWLDADDRRRRGN